MKKIKLITSLSSIVVLTIATPIIATSCSNNNEYKNSITFRGKTFELPDNLNPNYFCWVPSASTGIYYMVIPTKEDDDYIYLDESNYDQVTEVKLTSCDNTTKINNDFLSYLPELKSVDLSGLSKIVTIADRFLCNNNLESLNLSSLSDLTGIGDNFLSFSLLLDSDDIIVPDGGFKKLSWIGMDFMSNCFSLTNFDMNIFSYVEPENPTGHDVFKVGREFLESCFFLETVNVNNVLPDKFGYDTWTYDSETKTWGFERTDNNDIDTFACWTLSKVPAEKQKSLEIKIICDNNTVKDAWTQAYNSDYKGYQINKLDNYEYIDQETLETMFFGNRFLDIQTK